MHSAVLLFVTAFVVKVALTLSIFVLKWRFQSSKYKKPTRIDGKIVIITGAHRSIGKETAHQLSRRGGIIYMTSYDIRKCEAACAEIMQDTGNANIFCRQLDLASFKSIRKFVEDFKKEQDHLDVLINNDNVRQCPLMRTKNGLEMQLGVNHIGHFLLTNLLLDLLKHSQPSRIIVISSIAYKAGKINVDDLNSEKAYNMGDAFDQSKLANVLFTNALSKRLTGTGVCVNSVDPGIIDVELKREMVIFNSLFGRLILRPFIWPFLRTVENGAQNPIYAAIDPDLKQVSGKYISNLRIGEISGRGKDDSMAEWLWMESEKLTDLSA